MRVKEIGRIDYSKALELQLQTLDFVSKGEEDTIFICEHNPIVTLGRATEDGDITTWKGATIEVQRGGRATYHGPGQIVVYPILNLQNKKRDLHAYLRNLEQVVIDTLKDFDLAGEREDGATGVWVSKKKVASIGIAVKKWVTYHGLALNVKRGAQGNGGLQPCGFSQNIMTSMEALLENTISEEDVKASIKKHIQTHF